MPGQKSIRLAQKGRNSSFPGCWLPLFAAKPSLSPGISLRQQRRKEMGRFDPGRFCLRRLPFCPGNEKTDLIDQINCR